VECRVQTDRQTDLVFIIAAELLLLALQPVDEALRCDDACLPPCCAYLRTSGFVCSGCLFVTEARAPVHGPQTGTDSPILRATVGQTGSWCVVAK
jgi:hypothetical protein